MTDEDDVDVTPVVVLIPAAPEVLVVDWPGLLPPLPELVVVPPDPAPPLVVTPEPPEPLPAEVVVDEVEVEVVVVSTVEVVTTAEEVDTAAPLLDVCAGDVVEDAPAGTLVVVDETVVVVLAAAGAAEVVVGPAEDDVEVMPVQGGMIVPVEVL